MQESKREQEPSEDRGPETEGAVAPTSKGGARSAEAILHDVRGLLVTIASLTSDVHVEVHREAAPGAASRIRSKVTELGQAVEDARTLARQLPRGSAPSGLQILPFVTDHLGALASYFEGTRSILMSVDPRCSGALVAMDPTDLLRVLTNIVRNAAQAAAKRGTGEGGSVDMVLGVIELHEPAPVLGGAMLMDGAYVQLVITDDGIGLPLGLVETYASPRAPLPAGRGAPGNLGLWTVIELLTEVKGGLILTDRRAPDGPGARAEILIPRIDRDRP